MEINQKNWVRHKLTSIITAFAGIYKLCFNFMCHVAWFTISLNIQTYCFELQKSAEVAVKMVRYHW